MHICFVSVFISIPIIIHIIHVFVILLFFIKLLKYMYKLHFFLFLLIVFSCDKIHWQLIRYFPFYHFMQLFLNDVCQLNIFYIFIFEYFNSSLIFLFIIYFLFI